MTVLTWLFGRSPPPPRRSPILAGELILVVPVTDLLYWNAHFQQQVPLWGKRWEVDWVEVVEDANHGSVVEVALVLVETNHAISRSNPHSL